MPVLSSSLRLFEKSSLYTKLGMASATVGKHLLGLRITDLSGKPVSLPQALLRNFLKLLPWNLTHVGLFAPSATGLVSLGELPASMNWWWSFLLLADLLVLLYLLSSLVTGGHRSVHDILSRTYLVYTSVKR